MKIMDGKTEGNITIAEDAELKGMIVGDVIVPEDVDFKIRGMLIGNLAIHINSKVKIHGMIKGNVVNSGGNLEVYGVINGTLVKESGTTFIDENAIVK